MLPPKRVAELQLCVVLLQELAEHVPVETARQLQAVVQNVVPEQLQQVRHVGERVYVPVKRSRALTIDNTGLMNSII